MFEEDKKVTEIRKQFEKHEAEDQRRFELQEKDHNILFKKVSEVYGYMNEKNKENKEAGTIFMSELKEAKKDINDLKVDIKEVKTNVVWIKEKLEEENKREESTKKDMVLKEEFDPVRNLVYGMVGIICLTVLATLITKAIQIINVYFKLY